MTPPHFRGERTTATQHPPRPGPLPRRSPGLRALHGTTAPLRLAASLGLVWTLLLGCDWPAIDNSEEAAAAVRAQSNGSFPYHPLVFHLDLSILAYQVYGQSLVWPFDPYYEDVTGHRGARNRLMDQVRGWATTTGSAQVASDPGLDGFRGPGRLAGFDDNPAHDPVVYQYSRVHPWSTTLTNPDRRWTEYQTPGAILRKVREVHVCFRTTGQPEGTVTRAALPDRPRDVEADANDLLLAFEGGTGDKGEDGQAVSHSLMGLALVRDRGEGGAYDVHIAFRGSRSGSGSRSVYQAIPSDEARGNADWITDLGTRMVEAPFISTTGKVARGMARTVETLVPQLFVCLDQLVGSVRAQPPANIYVTGHSLGGGLTQLFASAVLLGDRFSPGGSGMPASLSGWPWATLKAISFSAPQVGNEDWARALTTDKLDSIYFARNLPTLYDPDAFSMTEQGILPDLLDVSSAAGYRVLLPKDPVTTRFIPDGKHVGKTVYLEQPRRRDPPTPSFEAHEPINVRNAMVDTFRDPRIPASAWAYHELEDLGVDRDNRNLGSVEEYDKLVDAIRRYYDGKGLWFDRDGLDRAQVVFNELVHGM